MDAQEENYDTVENSDNVPINQGRWLDDEHEMFLSGLKTHGKEWNKIAELVKSRTVVQIRTHAQKYFQKVAKATGGPVMSTSKKADLIRATDKKQNRLMRRLAKVAFYDSGDEIPDEYGQKPTERSPSYRRNRKSREIKEGFGDRSMSDAGESADENYSEPENPYKRKTKKRERSTPTTSKPRNIRVPDFSRAGGSGAAAPHNKSRRLAGLDDGGVTPRTVAAATILLQPRIKHRLLSGSDTPKTRQQASWLESRGSQGSVALGSDSSRRASPKSEHAVLSWETATAQP